jgi:putative thioredoxin
MDFPQDNNANLMMGAGHASAPQDTAAQIIDVTMQNFLDEVVEGSKTIPVIVQFWAPWCGPCKQLGPILEQEVTKNGKVRMVRVNIDENQEIAAQLRVQSVPTVYAFVNGQPVDGFAGAQAGSAVSEFVTKLAAMAPGAPDITPLLAAGEAALSQNDGAAAYEAFQQAMAQVPESLEALAGLIKAMVALGDLENAQEIIEALEEDQLEKPFMREAQAAVELAVKMAANSGEAASDFAALEAAIAADEKNLEARFELAMAYFAAGRKEEAMAQLLESIRIDKDHNEGAAKIQLLEFFEAIGVGDAMVIKARRKLSSYLFS